MRALGIYLKKEEVKATMTRVDKDGSGTIELMEFTALMAEQIDGRNQEDEIRKVFRVYDDDDNGLISLDNLQRCAEDLEEDCTEEEFEMMIKMGDYNDKKQVDQDNFVDLMKELGLI